MDLGNLYHLCIGMKINSTYDAIEYSHFRGTILYLY